MFNKIVAAAAASAMGLAQAATYTVDSIDDDGSTGTLRWAIEQSNANSGQADVIVFDPDLSGQTIFFDDPSPNGNFQLLLSSELVIDGSNAPGLSIDRNGGGRIFIVSNDNDITIRGLRLTNSNGLFAGACLRISAAAPTVIVESVHFDGCTIRESSGGDDALGGALYADMEPGGSLTVTSSLFENNRVSGDSASLHGGAIHVNGGNVTLSSNRFESNSVVDEGQAFSIGGAVYIRDAVTSLTQNVFEDNADISGAGGALGINILPAQAALLTRNLFIGNKAELGAALWTGTQTIGGAPQVDLTNNQFIDNYAGPSANGGAIYFREGTIRMRNNTMAGNRAVGSAAAHLAYRSGTNPVVFSQFWNNAFGKTPDNACKASSGTPVSFPSAGYNLFPDTTCQISGPGTVIDPDAAFHPPGANGGPIFTARPVAGNPAIEGGNPGTPDAADWTRCAPEDARLAGRPFDADNSGIAVCDMGAFEWQTEPLPLPTLLRDRFEAQP